MLSHHTGGSARSRLPLAAAARAGLLVQDGGDVAVRLLHRLEEDGVHHLPRNLHLQQHRLLGVAGRHRVGDGRVPVRRGVLRRVGRARALTATKRQAGTGAQGARASARALTFFAGRSSFTRGSTGGAASGGDGGARNISSVCVAARGARARRRRPNWGGADENVQRLRGARSAYQGGTGRYREVRDGWWTPFLRELSNLPTSTGQTPHAKILITDLLSIYSPPAAPSSTAAAFFFLFLTAVL